MKVNKAIKASKNKKR